MTVSTPVRLLIGFGAIGGAVGTGYAINQKLSTEDIRKKLIVNGYEILGDFPETWKSILTSYSSTVAEEKNKDLKFGDFDGKEPNNDVAKLKEKCAETLKLLSASNDADYKKAEKWCTVPKSFKSILEKQGYTVLDVDEKDDSKNQKEWNAKIEDHKREENKTKRFDGLVSEGDKAIKNDEESRKLIKAKCKDVLEKFHYEKDYDTILEKSTLWCAIKE